MERKPLGVGAGIQEVGPMTTLLLCIAYVLIAWKVMDVISGEGK